MNSRRMLAILAGTFLVFGAIGSFFHMTKTSFDPDDGAPVLTMTFLTLGTGCIAFIAWLRK
jgi:hypothetical protein